MLGKICNNVTILKTFPRAPSQTFPVLSSFLSPIDRWTQHTVSVRWDLVSFFTFIFRHSSCLEFDDIIKKYSSKKGRKILEVFYFIFKFHISCLLFFVWMLYNNHNHWYEKEKKSLMCFTFSKIKCFLFTGWCVVFQFYFYISVYK